MAGISLPVLKIFNPFAITECFALISLPAGSISEFLIYPEFLAYLNLAAKKDLDFNLLSTGVGEKNLEIFNLLDPKHAHYPRGFQYFDRNQTLVDLRNAVESQLVECGKSVFISRPDNIHTEFQFMTRHYPSKKFYKGKEVLGVSPIGWYFYRVGVSKVPRYFKRVVETGIFHRLRDEDNFQKLLSRSPVSKNTMEQSVQLVELCGAILTVFIICGICISGAILIFVAEIRYKMCTSTKIILKSWHSKLSKIESFLLRIN